MKVEPEDFGPVRFTRGKYKGRVGYYDDDGCPCAMNDCSCGHGYIDRDANNEFTCAACGGKA